MPTPTPGGNCSGQLFSDPGFENGGIGWNSTAYVINTDGAYSHSGVGYAWLDGYGYSHTDTLSQSVHITSGCKATLSYWLMVQSYESNNGVYDTIKVQINGSTKQTYTNLNDGAYTLRSLDLSAYSGQTITIKWVGTEGNGPGSSFFVDDTAVNLHN